jgi:hypothetical protein
MGLVMAMVMVLVLVMAMVLVPGVGVGGGRSGHLGVFPRFPVGCFAFGFVLFSCDFMFPCLGREAVGVCGDSIQLSLWILFMRGIGYMAVAKR